MIATKEAEGCAVRDAKKVGGVRMLRGCRCAVRLSVHLPVKHCGVRHKGGIGRDSSGHSLAVAGADRLVSWAPGWGVAEGLDGVCKTVLA